jgi:PIN domain nuclease of toxin-antitoxin system
VLDASAILAAIGNEPGGEKVLRLVLDAVVSTVNLAEVKSKLVERGFPPAEAWDAANSFSRAAFDFDPEQASIVGDLLPSARPLGLSLGDRACLALGIVLKAPVYTADRDWSKLNLDLDIHVIR